MYYFIAHIIQQLIFPSRSEMVEVWETMVLIKAKDHDHAYKKAEKVVKKQFKDTKPQFPDDIQLKTLGVKNVYRAYVDKGKRPKNGDELTLNKYLVKNDVDAEKFADYEEVWLLQEKYKDLI